MPPAVRETVQRVQAALRTNGWPLRLTRPEDVHLTLKFYGDVAPQDIGRLVEAVTPMFAGTACLSAHTAGLGVFPSPAAPRVLWLGFDEDTGALRDLVGRINHASARLGFPRERRPFRAHLTIGRFRDGVSAPPNLMAALRTFTPEPRAVAISSAELMRSVLSPSGPAYTSLHTWPFNSPSAGVERPVAPASGHG
jgi:2'-5' RNA ligase